jgi:folate-binding protein YgfZ
MVDAVEGYELLRHSVGAVWLDRDVVRVSGPDAVSFLQGQCSQDIAGLGVGQSAWSLVLQPQGKVDALVRVARLTDDAVLLDTDGGFGEALIARLSRFKLRVKAQIEPLAWRCLALRGPDASIAAADLVGADHLVLDASWPGLPGVDVLGPEPGPTIPAGVPLVDPSAYEAVRIEAGAPTMGAELTERTIPAEAGIVDRTVSFTKGCFTGQELVARIDSRGGNVPRHLRGLVLDGAVPLGASVMVGAKQVGAITSVASRPERTVALAYVGRDVEPPMDASIEWEGGRAVARIESLPIPS